MNPLTIAASIAAQIAATIGARRAERNRRARVLAQAESVYRADLAAWENELADKGQTS